MSAPSNLADFFWAIMQDAAKSKHDPETHLEALRVMLRKTNRSNAGRPERQFSRI